MDGIREIGIEKECFLIKNNKIMEPRIYGFPKDEFEFLVELRSLPSDKLYPVYTTLQQEELQYSLRANNFGMELKATDSMIASKKWVDTLWDKYDLHRFNDADYTQNIYGKPKQSHHFGVLDTSNINEKKLTAGMHVHFSKRDPKTGKAIELPIEKIVKNMDNIFVKEIKLAGRNLGEWEPKAHGFEYRSLPANIDVYKVLKESFTILRKY